MKGRNGVYRDVYLEGKSVVGKRMRVEPESLTEGKKVKRGIAELLDDKDNMVKRNIGLWWMPMEL